MGDKQSQQRRRRADGAVRSVADRSAVEENRALAPQTAQTTQGRSSVDRKSPCAGRDFVDSAERGTLAGPAGEIPASFDVLAATARLGGAGRLVEHLAGVSERVERAPATEVERVVSGREFCSREKRGCGVGKTKRGKGTKWMVVVDGRGLPLGNYLHSASPAEVKLAETTLATIRVRRSHHSGRPRQKPMRVDCRQSLRQRSAAGALAAARNRTDLSTQEESRSAGNPGRTSLATLQAAMDRGTHQCLAGKLPTPGGALRSLSHDLWRVLSYRLLHDRLTKGCAIASSQLKRSPASF